MQLAQTRKEIYIAWDVSNLLARENKGKSPYSSLGLIVIFPICGSCTTSKQHHFPLREKPLAFTKPDVITS